MGDLEYFKVDHPKMEREIDLAGETLQINKLSWQSVFALSGAERRRSAGLLKILRLVYVAPTNGAPPLDAMGLLDLIGKVQYLAGAT